MTDPLSALDDLDSYRRLFTDADFWAPYVRQVCRRHGFVPCEPIRLGVPGTCPVFIIADRWLVKFFGRLFDGAESFAVEQEANRLAAQDPAIPAARVLASGSLRAEDWPWPYLVYAFIPAISAGEAAEQAAGGQLLPADRLQIAADMGGIVRRLHALPLAGSPVFPNDWAPYRRFLDGQRAVCMQNQRDWGSLPAHLVDQIDAFMPPLENLVDSGRPPHLIHADLTRDHLLGRIENGRWRTMALIDFGDAMTGSLLYELAALHMDLFDRDPAMLSAFLDTYGIDPAARAGLPQKALATSLLHRFNMFFNLSAEQVNVGTLDELAQAIWGPAALSDLIV